MSSETPEKLEYSFAGKKVLVTGGGRGLGHALVSRFYKDGATVYTLERDAALVTQLRQDFPDETRLKAEVCDISNWNETQALIESFGPVHHLVNSAGIVLMSSFLDVEEDQVDKTFDVNLKSLFCTSQAVAKGMIAGGIRGTMVNIASIGGHAACHGISVYCVAKAGVIMLTKCLAYELGQHGIRVNSVSPTGIDTPMYRDNLKRDAAFDLSNNPLIARQPLSGSIILQPDDVVNTVLYLLSPLSSLANGMDLRLDGGILAC